MKIRVEKVIKDFYYVDLNEEDAQKVITHAAVYHLSWEDAVQELMDEGELSIPSYEWTFFDNEETIIWADDIE